MYSFDGLTLEQIALCRDVQGARYDPELGEGRLMPGSPPVFQPVGGGRVAGTPAPWGSWIQRIPWPFQPGRRQDLGAATVDAAPAGPMRPGEPPTAPSPANAARAGAGPAWSIRVSPDDLLRAGNPSLGRY